MDKKLTSEQIKYHLDQLFHAAEAEDLFTKYVRSIQTLVTNVGEEGNCRSCGAPIWWIKHRNGRTGIYNIDGTSHFSTCPDAQNHRKVDQK
jgi:hypothetical protein